MSRDQEKKKGQNTPEYVRFRKNLYDLYTGIAREVLAVASIAKAEKLIGDNSLANAGNERNNELGRANELTQIFLSRIEGCSDDFYKILNIYKTLPTLSRLVTLLEPQPPSHAQQASGLAIIVPPPTEMVTDSGTPLEARPPIAVEDEIDSEVPNGVPVVPRANTNGELLDCIGTGPILRSEVARKEQDEIVGSHEYAEVGAGAYEVPLVSSSASLNPTSMTKLEESIYMVPGQDESSLYQQLNQLKAKSLKRNDIKLGALLGSGQFGKVHKGVLESGGGEVEVAVKTLKEGSGEEDRIKLLQEAAIMAQFKHHNVVTMYGVVKQGEPILVLELLGKGDLLDHLLHMRSDEEGTVSVDGHTLLSYCRQVASGMTYLSSKAFVHRDLAARNILVSQDETCKIADFGMSRDLMDESYYVSHGGKIPVKWTAPEALHLKKYSTASDVWSYGVLMYEIWSLGHKPFEGYVNNEVMTVVDTGYRLPPPPGCPRALYTIMMSCWHPVASERLSFLDITQQLSLPDTKLLKWSEEDKSVRPEAARLGADLLCGEELYKDLQTRYQE